MDYVDYGEFIFIQMYTNRCNPITRKQLEKLNTILNPKIS